VARRVRDGHPWIFAEALRGRQLAGPAGQVLDVTDPDGEFVARAVVDPEGSPALRVVARHPGAALDRAALLARVSACARVRLSLLVPDAISCYRVVSGDSEGIPAVTVDRYGAFLVVSSYSAVVETYSEALIAALAEALAPLDGIYLQRRFVPAVPGRPRPAAELVWGAAAPPEVIVAEGRTRFVVDVSAPGGTGIYPDMRLGREAVARHAAGRRVLNCFSYTGAFSVVAALHGATSVVSVDAASRAHGRARRNFAENRIPESSDHEFITGDTFAALARLQEHGRRFDLVILDPPTFSSGKGRPFTALRDYADLVAAAMPVLADGGLLVAASNAAKLPAADLDRALGRGASLAGRELVITAQLGLPPDFPVSPAFPEGSYLKIFVARAL
jgi:23S rRNA (cytosine1962-C5)-methyltransferase